MELRNRLGKTASFSPIIELDAIGDGSINKPFRVGTPEQLDAVWNNLDKHFIQTADIDLSEYPNWEPIGNYTNRFTGSYNGTVSDCSSSGSVNGEVNGRTGGLIGYLRGTNAGEISTVVIKRLAEHKMPFSVENTGVRLDFAPDSLNLTQVTGATGKTVMEIGAREVTGVE